VLSVLSFCILIFLMVTSLVLKLAVCCICSIFHCCACADDNIDETYGINVQFEESEEEVVCNLICVVYCMT